MQEVRHASANASWKQRQVFRNLTEGLEPQGLVHIRKSTGIKSEVFARLLVLKSKHHRITRSPLCKP